MTDDAMTTREPVCLEHPDDLGSRATRRTFAATLVDTIIAAVNAERERQGKPPL